MAAIAAAAEQNSPTKGNPPIMSIKPPTDAPPMTPNWLHTVNIPVAVARDRPAKSVRLGEVGDKTLLFVKRL